MSISKKFVDRIEELKHHTKTNMDDIQNCCCPMVKNIYLHRQFEYWYDGYKYNIWEENTRLYAVKEIPYCYDNELKNVIFKGKLQDLIEQDKIWPFLLFVNGEVVPWSKITIIRDYDYSYLRIDGDIADFLDSAKIIYFPLGSKEIRYGEDEDYLKDPETNGLYFNKTGKLLISPEFEELSVRFEFKSDIYFRIIKAKDIPIPEEKNTHPIFSFEGLKEGKVPTLNNMIIFDSYGNLQCSASEIDDKIMDELNGVYSYFYIHKSFMDLEPLILQMYFEKHTESTSYPYTKEDLDKDKVKLIMSHLNETPFNILANTVLSSFDFKFSNETTYEDNIYKTSRYISRYDYALWNKIFIDEAPIKSFTYTGREFKKLSDLRSYVRFSRHHSDYIEDIAMMFVNSILYTYSIDISYTNNTINIPAFGILDEDVVEIIIFTKCNNNVLDIIFPDNSTTVYIHPEYALEDCYIMDNETSLAKYTDVPDSPQGRKQYICKITSMRKESENKYIINFEDPFHYGRKLKIVPKNQFRYYRYSRSEGSEPQGIILPQQFNYCHDMDRYMIFMNGRKIDKTEYTITVMNEYRPFDKLVLYVTSILDTNDRVDIFYVPEYLVEKYKVPETYLDGTIRLITNYPKMYAMSKNTCMIFVNGFKINPLDIKDVSMNTIMIDTKYNTINNVTVVEYLNGSKEMFKYLYGAAGIVPIAGDINPDPAYIELKDVCGTILQSNNKYDLGVENDDLSLYLYDLWQYLMDELSRYYCGLDNEGDIAFQDKHVTKAINCIYELFPSLEPKTILPNYKNDYATLRAVLYDIIVDFYVQRNEKQTGDIFDYDFEIEQWLDDALGNKDITLYPDHDKLFDYILSVKETSEDKVAKDKKYLDI